MICAISMSLQVSERMYLHVSRTPINHLIVLWPRERLAAGNRSLGDRSEPLPMEKYEAKKNSKLLLLCAISGVCRCRPTRWQLGWRSATWASGSTLSCETPSIPPVVRAISPLNLIAELPSHLKLFMSKNNFGDWRLTCNIFREMEGLACNILKMEN